MNLSIETLLSASIATAIGGLLLGAALLAPPLGVAHAQASPIPAPSATTKASPASARSETVTFAGGCFWGVQGVFQHVNGVQRAVSGYAGGNLANPRYEVVSTGRTGHAESVQVTYDPSKVSYAQLLQVFFSVVHDPTQLNMQGPDHGTQYRSAVFTTTPMQRQATTAYIAQLEKAHVFRAPIVTQVGGAVPFYPAEAYHQNYLTLHPDELYIRFNDAPKVRDLQRLYPALYRAKPVLVAAR